MFNETLRLFPPVITIPKQSAEDTSFTTTNAAGEKRTIPVPKGTFVTVHTPGLHNNRTSCSLIYLPVFPSCSLIHTPSIPIHAHISRN